MREKSKRHRLLVWCSPAYPHSPLNKHTFPPQTLLAPPPPSFPLPPLRPNSSTPDSLVPNAHLPLSPSSPSYLPPPRPSFAKPAPTRSLTTTPMPNAPSSPQPRAACPNSFAYENPICANNGTLHIAPSDGGATSCSSCDCQEGWQGVDCGRCIDVSACPARTINGTVSCKGGGEGVEGGAGGESEGKERGGGGRAGWRRDTNLFPIR